MSVTYRARDVIISFFVENIPLKLVSLGLAVAIWAWVQSTQVTERTYRVRVSYAWPSALVRVDDVPARLRVTLEGPQSVLLPLEQRRLSMVVDLTDGTEGVNEVDFSVQRLEGLPQGVTVTQISPPVKDVTLEPPMEKEVPVTLSTIGQPPRGYEIKALSVEPPTVMISGPKSQIQNVSQAPTDVIDLNGTRQDTVLEVPLTPGNMVRSLWEGPVTVTVDVEPIETTRTFPAVPVVVRGAGWRAETESIQLTLRGPFETLEAIDSAGLSVMAQVPAGADPEQSTLEMRYNSEDAGELSLVGVDTSDIVFTELSPPTVILRRIPEEE